MSKKQAIILLTSSILIGFLAIQPFNYICRLTDWCEPISISYYLPKKTGNKMFDVVFEAKDSSESVNFRNLTRSAVILSGSDFELKYEARNKSDKNIKIRPRRYIKPIEAAKYIEFYECLCFKEYDIDANDKKDLIVRFRIKPEIEKDEFFKNSSAIIIGYELSDD